MSYHSSCSSGGGAVYSEGEDSTCITSSSSLEVTSSTCVEPFKSELVDEEDHCCCVSTEELGADIIDQPLVGWEKVSPHPNSSGSGLSAQAPERSSCAVVESCNQMCRANSSNDRVSSRSPLSRAVINLGSESKSSLRSYIHSTPAIPYTFRHHLDGDTALYIEEYRNSYTYPNMEEKHRKTSSNSAGTAAIVKPTLFVLDNDCTIPTPLNRLDSMCGLRKRMNSLGVNSSPCHSGSIVPQVLPKNRELGVPRNSKERVYYSAWKTAGIASQSCRPRKVWESAALNSGAIESFKISGTYVTNTIPVLSPSTPRAGGTPITQVKPQPTWVGVHRKPSTGKTNVKPVLVNNCAFPVKTGHQVRNCTSKTVTSSKIKAKGHSPNHRTKAQDKQ